MGRNTGYKTGSRVQIYWRKRVEDRVTEAEIATHGATAGESVGDDVWTSRGLPAAGWNNVEQMLGGRIDGAIVYGTVSFYSPRQQETTMYVGSRFSFRVLLNGDEIYESLGYHASSDYTDFLPVTLRQGKNVLLVAIGANDNAFFGFEPGTEYTVAIRYKLRLFRDANLPRRYLYLRCPRRKCFRLGGLAV